MRSAILIGALTISGAPLESWLVFVIVGSMLMDLAELLAILNRRRD